MMLTREQVRAARAARGWGVRELATAIVVRFPDARISFVTISAFENGADSRGETMRRIQIALEGEGFTFTNSGRPGVTWDDEAPQRWATATEQQKGEASGVSAARRSAAPPKERLKAKRRRRQ
jgi:transcriptional regulator with XRE-family HTH domain